MPGESAAGLAARASLSQDEEPSDYAHRRRWAPPLTRLAFFEACMQKYVRFIRLPLPVPPPVSNRPRLTVIQPSPEDFESIGSRFENTPPPQRPSDNTRSTPYDAEPYLPGFLPSSRHHRAHPLSARLPAPLRSARRLSQPLDGFLRARLRGLIPSRGHVQGFLFRASPSAQQLFLIERALPPCRWVGAAAGCSQRHGLHPRLRGLPPCGDAFVQLGDWPSLCRSRLQCPPPGLPLSRREPSYLGHPLLASRADLRFRAHRFRAPAAFCRRESWLCPSPDLQPARGFGPSVDLSVARPRALTLTADRQARVLNAVAMPEAHKRFCLEKVVLDKPDMMHVLRRSSFCIRFSGKDMQKMRAFQQGDYQVR